MISVRFVADQDMPMDGMRWLKLERPDGAVVYFVAESTRDQATATMAGCCSDLVVAA